MKPEMLEPLLLDRALGALPPEVAELLEAYLAQNPDAARRAATLIETLQLARTAVATPRETPPPLDVNRLRRSHHDTRVTAWSTQALRLVACLIFGLIAGWNLRPAPKPVVAPVVVQAPVPSHPAEPTTHFWSVARFAPEAAGQKPGRKL